jgi:hypothetical protein
MKAIWLMAAVTACACAAGPGWTDRAEYDLVLNIRAEATPQKRVALLDAWKARYPQSELRQVRRELYLAAFQEISDSARMLEVAREMVADPAGSLVGAYWCTLLIPTARNPSPELWALGEKAARQLMTAPHADGAPDPQLQAHRMLAWIAWQRGDFTAAEPEFQAYLKKDPKNAEMTAWYGLAMASRKKPEAVPPALWQLARAVSMKDEPLPEMTRRQVNDLVDRIYASYHGSSEGVEQLRTAAAAQAAPPADFKIESASDIAARRAAEELQRSNPMLASWLSIRKQLESADGEKYFTETLRPAPLPKLKATVIRCTPEKAPTEVVLGVSNAVTEEVLLKLSAPMPHGAAPGNEIQFEGAAESFTKAPFQLVVTASPDKISGWPAK